MKRVDMVIEDVYWENIIQKMCKEIIPYQYQVLNDEVKDIPQSHAIENFRIASGEKQGIYSGMLFQDSDVAKWIEAAAYSLRIQNNEEIEQKIEGLIDLIERTQQDDGYLDTYYICEKQKEKLGNIAHGHEMYCAGHLLEAAVAYAEVTGKERFLRIMEKCIRWFMDRIGPEDGKRCIYTGHPELELALYRLYQYTNNKEYYDFMQYLLLERGKQPSFLLNDSGYGEQYHDRWFGLEYHQAHKPVMDQTEAVGHAVRAMYLYAGLADFAERSSDQKYVDRLMELWDDVTQKKMYITGSIGSDEHGECFSSSYDLPNDRAYAETCASIGLFMWGRRMLKLQLNSKFSDVMEQALYNGILSGISEDGKSYFYVNPLEVNPVKAHQRYDMRHIQTERVRWLGCACCPPNVARVISSLERYVYDESQVEHALSVHLYLCGRICTTNGQIWKLTGNYMKDGVICIEYQGENLFCTLKLRNPGWSLNTRVYINMVEEQVQSENGYLIISRNWKEGDRVQLCFDLKAKMVYSNVRVQDNAGKTAIMRGPVVFCAEETDNGKDLSALLVKDIERHSEGSVWLSGYRECTEPQNELYSFIPPKKQAVEIRMIPYSQWGNRGEGEMRVWMRKEY